RRPATPGNGPGPRRSANACTCCSIRCSPGFRTTRASCASASAPAWSWRTWHSPTRAGRSPRSNPRPRCSTPAAAARRRMDSQRAAASTTGSWARRRPTARTRPPPRARTPPGWPFSAVAPSAAMLAACRSRAEADGFAARCRFHHGFLDTLPADAPYQAATCFLVSQFIVDRAERARFFAGIAARLAGGGLLASTDLAADTASPAYATLLPAWMQMMAAAEVTPEAIERIRQAYARDVAVLPPDQIESILADGGFDNPARFF